MNQICKVLVTRYVLPYYQSFTQKFGLFILVLGMFAIINWQLVAMLRRHLRFCYQAFAEPNLCFLWLPVKFCREGNGFAPVLVKVKLDVIVFHAFLLICNVADRKYCDRTLSPLQDFLPKGWLLRIDLESFNILKSYEVEMSIGSLEVYGFSVKYSKV